MKICQTIRSLVVARARVLAVGAGLCLLAAVPAVGQVRGPQGGRVGGGMRPHAFMAPAPLPVIAPRMGLQLGLGGRWWDEDKTIKKLNLRSDQQKRMDDIFASNKKSLQKLYDNLQREQARLASLPSGDLQDETKVFAAIDRVADARTELEKANAHYLLQIRQQMDPDQLSALDKQIADANANASSNAR